MIFNLHNVQRMCVCISLTDYLFGREICHSAGKSMVKNPTLNVWCSSGGDDRGRGMQSAL